MKEPIRICIGCGRKAPQGQLLRFVAPEGHLRRDEALRSSGRGAYTCPRPACFERAASRLAFSRALRRNVTIPQELTTDLWLTDKDH